VTWVKIEDGFTEHPKVLQVGPLGAWIHLQGLCYTSRNLSDGFVPLGAAKAFNHVAMEHIGVDYASIGERGKEIDSFGEDAVEINWSSELVSVGLWHRADGRRGACKCIPDRKRRGGFWIHDYLKYNPSRELVLKERAAARERMSRQRSPNVRPNIPRSSTEVQQSPSPSPTHIKEPPYIPPQGGRERERKTKRFRETDIGKGPEEFEADRKQRELVRQLAQGALRPMP
jgi:hypothetical protein